MTMKNSCIRNVHRPFDLFIDPKLTVNKNFNFFKIILTKPNIQLILCFAICLLFIIKKLLILSDTLSLLLVT